MINAEDETITDRRGSCTLDEAVAKMLGWMQGDIRKRMIPVSADGCISDDDLKHLYSFEGTSSDGSLWAMLDEFRESASVRFLNAVAADAEFDVAVELENKVTAWKARIVEAKTYLREIKSELAKGDLSRIKIDTIDTNELGVTHITLDSFELWIKARSQGNTVPVSEDAVVGNTQGLDKVEESKKGQKVMSARHDAIKAAIAELGHDPKNLPTVGKGYKGIRGNVKDMLGVPKKDDVLNKLFPSTKIFEDTWQSMLDDKIIANSL